MGIEEVMACDNPKCKNTGPFERVAGRGKRPATIMYPYGWDVIRVASEGSGPFIDVVACSSTCIMPAILFGWNEWYEKDRGSGMNPGIGMEVFGFPTECAKGYVWCDVHGSVHEATNQDDGTPECSAQEWRTLWMEKEQP